MRHHRLALAVVLAAGIAGPGIFVTLVAQQEAVDCAVVARIQAEAHSAVEGARDLQLHHQRHRRPPHRQPRAQAGGGLPARPAGRVGDDEPAPRIVPVRPGRLGASEIHTRADGAALLPDVRFPAAWSTSTKGVLEGTPIYIGDKTSAEIEALGEKLRGAIVLMTPPQTVFTSVDRLDPTVSGQPAGTMPPTSPQRQEQPRAGTNDISTLLRRFGAGAVLRPSAGKDDTIFIGAATAGQDAVPQVTVVTEHYNMIVRMMQAGVTPKLRLELRAAFEPADKISYNVIADIPGEDPVLKNEIVLLGAHLDSWHAATGATDNADGAAAASEAMRILKVIGVHPRRTIRLAIWSGEEVGFLGGKAYVDQHLKDQASRDAIAVYLNDDPGTGATLGWFMANNDASKKILDSWVDQLKDLGMRKNTMDAYFSSEDGVFDAVGVPAFTTIQDYTNYDVRLHHTNTDFYEAISEKDLEQSATVLAAFAYQASMREREVPGAGPREFPRIPMHRQRAAAVVRHPSAQHPRAEVQRPQGAVASRPPEPPAVVNPSHWWRPGLVVLAGVLAYGNSLSRPFLFDDELTVVQNASIRTWWNLSRVFSPAREFPVAGRPLVNLSFALNYALGGLHARGYHVVNLLLHLACAVLLFALVRRSLTLPRLRHAFGGHAGDLALAVALLWVVHPLNSEVVDYVTQRTESMMAVCYSRPSWPASAPSGPADGGGWQPASRSVRWGWPVRNRWSPRR